MLVEQCLYGKSVFWNARVAIVRSAPLENYRLSLICDNSVKTTSNLSQSTVYSTACCADTELLALRSKRVTISANFDKRFFFPRNDYPDEIKLLMRAKKNLWILNVDRA